MQRLNSGEVHNFVLDLLKLEPTTNLNHLGKIDYETSRPQWWPDGARFSRVQDLRNQELVSAATAMYTFHKQQEKLLGDPKNNLDPYNLSDLRANNEQGNIPCKYTVFCQISFRNVHSCHVIYFQLTALQAIMCRQKYNV